MGTRTGLDGCGKSRAPLGFDPLPKYIYIYIYIYTLITSQASLPTVVLCFKLVGIM